MPSPRALESSSVSLSSHSAPPLASGRWKPPATKALVAISNSRRTTASPPPRDRRRIARSWLRGNVDDPLQIQSSASLAANLRLADGKFLGDLSFNGSCYAH